MAGALELEETELRLGLPGGEAAGGRSSGKRGFAETIDLKLKLQAPAAGEQDGRDAPPPAAADGTTMKRSPSQGSVVALAAQQDPEKPRAPKAQVVGWPPVRSTFRKNILAVQAGKGGGGSKDDGEGRPAAAAAAPPAFVKVSMDGAPYLRKVDLGMYSSYRELSMALQKLFGSFTTIVGGEQGRKGSDYAPTYEDKDGDWMLVGDVPWEMFVESCRRLRIMKGSEAIGLEKCKSRS